MLFSFSNRNTSLHALLAFKVSIEKAAVILMDLPLYVICFFSLTAVSILSLVSVLVVLMIICHHPQVSTYPITSHPINFKFFLT
jgi:hypothetical protein